MSPSGYAGARFLAWFLEQRIHSVKSTLCARGAGWNDGVMPLPDAGSAELLAADSFRVRSNAHSGDAEVRGGKAHLKRFALTARAAAHHDPTLVASLDSFLAEAVTQITAFGIGWPRLELWRSGAESSENRLELRLSLRALPELGASIGLRSATAIGVQHPERKGPNIARYADLNQHLEAEALLLDEHGYVLEGATTSLLWWEDDLLCVAASAKRVDSITEALIVEYAQHRGARVLHANALPSDLAEAEIWAVNALHGIRPVTRLDQKPLRAPREDRLREYSSALDRSWRPIR